MREFIVLLLGEGLYEAIASVSFVMAAVLISVRLLELIFRGPAKSRKVRISRMKRDLLAIIIYSILATMMLAIVYA